MPIQPTYPGVYIEEVSSGVRTITGVATSTTAFIGRSLKGPVNEPTTIFSFGDFERQFGDLWVKSSMSYAVKDFFINGGSQAIIVRITRTHGNGDQEGSEASHAGLTSALVNTGDQTVLNEEVTLEARNPGNWGNTLGVEINHSTADPTGNGQVDTSVFNLFVYVNGVKTEKYLNVSLDEEKVRYLPRVLDQASDLIQVRKINDEWPNYPDYRLALTAPVSTPVSLTGGSDGSELETNDYLGSETEKTGIHALRSVDLFNLLCIPPATRLGTVHPSIYTQAVKICRDKRAMLIVDPPYAWGLSPTTAVSKAIDGLGGLGITGPEAQNAALYFPRVLQADPKRDGQIDTFVPCGIIAGLLSKTDVSRGVWKSPAGLDAALLGIRGLQVKLSDPESGQLNPLAINCLRSFPVHGSVVWGARTMRGADQLADEYKYIAVRRMALFIEESLYRGTQWVVFEPNAEPLWAQIRQNIGAFMHNLFRQGAFFGTTPREAYLVKCDKETTTQNDIDRGIVNITVGFAPLKPAEFVMIKIQQLSGQIDT